MKVAFLDRDGTINQSFWTREHEGGPEYWHGPEEPILLPGTLEGLRHLKSCGYEIIIITNQYPIGEGQVTQEFYDSYMQKLLAMLEEGGAAVKDVFSARTAETKAAPAASPAPA